MTARGAVLWDKMEKCAVRWETVCLLEWRWGADRRVQRAGAAQAMADAGVGGMRRHCRSRARSSASRCGGPCWGSW